MATVMVKAAPGILVPKEGKPREYIEAAVVEVELSAYYQRRIVDGDLVMASGKQGKSSAPKAENNG